MDFPIPDVKDLCKICHLNNLDCISQKKNKKKQKIKNACATFTKCGQFCLHPDEFSKHCKELSVFNKLKIEEEKDLANKFEFEKSLREFKLHQEKKKDLDNEKKKVGNRRKGIQIGKRKIQVKTGRAKE
ncbi:hypothetical protein ACTFIY_008856 [Dictyostelium cf. discoideum]